MDCYIIASTLEGGWEFNILQKDGGRRAMKEDIDDDMNGGAGDDSLRGEPGNDRLDDGPDGDCGLGFGRSVNSLRQISCEGSKKTPGKYR
jgi:hypothetical protein